MTPTEKLRADLARLGVRRLLLAIHDTSFPSDPDEDVGRGSPATRAADRLFAYARALGFTGIQLGPQGQTSRTNPSPYDGTIFSRNLANIAVRSLRAGGAFEGLVDDASIDRWLVTGDGPSKHAHAYDAWHAIVDDAYASLERGARPDLRERLAVFRAEHASWLVSDALHSALCHARHCGFRGWDPRDRDVWLAGDGERIAELERTHAQAIDRYAFGQLLVHDEHARLRERCDMLLYGDLQVGYSDGDAWAYAGRFLRDYVMGAPPSRTNPEGQPWGYPVLDPDQYNGASRALVVARADKSFREYDSLRIDHPHGLVCPWVYRADAQDPALAVREGARLFESPDLPDHPALARFAIARPDQLDRALPRHADHWVRELDDAQITRYAILVDTLVAAAELHGRSKADLSFEVLSTMPYPLGRVLARHGLGRWRISQKADLGNPRDVYRTENAAREDWVMLGNHDTAPIFAVIRGWSPVQREAWANHLTERLRLQNPARLASDGFLATAMLAELFVSPAENVSIFFADLFGYEERFNLPGVVSSDNWSLRLPPSFEALHRERLAHERALDLPLAVELALAAQEHGAERR
jgi:4-alpha-glucanotransferase